MYNYTTTLRIRGNYLQKQLNKQQNNLLKDWKNCKKKIHTQKNVVNKTFFIVFFYLSTLSLIPFNACFPNKNPNFPKGDGPDKNILAPAAILSSKDGPLRNILRTVLTEAPPAWPRFRRLRLCVPRIFY